MWKLYLTHLMEEKEKKKNKKVKEIEKKGYKVEKTFNT